ncbi:sensor histidine kinase [Brevibacterium yomogidense]|uniref:sensor histidine kinase n=1 Tax=Brevibacterium yomogidense TaxID=946573 RepID=UPI0018DFB76D
MPAGRRIPAQLGRDYAYVLPGFFLSLFAFVALVPLFALSVGTLVVWVGALLLPLTLLIARAFAQLSRARLRHWGAQVPTPVYRSAQPGMLGWVNTIADPRVWLDLAFETVLAFPVRILTFVVAVAWSAGALGGITYPLWGVFLPSDEVGLLELILDAVSDGSLSLAPGAGFLVEAAFRVVTGLVLLLTLPWVMRGLAHLDALVTTAALGTPVRLSTAAPSHPYPATEAAPSPRPVTEATPSPRPTATADGWAWLTTGFAAAVLVAVGWPVLSVLYGVHVVLAMVVVLVHAASLVVAVRWSALGIVGNAAAVLGTALLSGSVLGPPWPWPVTTLLLHCFVVLLLALRHPWPVPVVAWATGSAVPLVAILLLRTDGLAGAVDSMIIAGPVSAGVAALGIVVRQLVRSRAALQTERRTSAELSAKRHQLQERNRIAQELHDVVAHSMSVISVQATTAEYRLSDVDAATAREFTSIADSSRRALNEMRGLLTILRGSGKAPLVPQPTLADVPTLVEATRRSGTHISFASTPERLDSDSAAASAATAAIPAATGLTAYRVVQEALSNAVRHSPGAAIDVRVDVTDHRIVLHVTNGPAATTGPAATEDPGVTESPAAEAASGSRVPSAPGAGLGLAGIRERVAALAGSVEAGPRADGGFLVHVELPTR